MSTIDEAAEALGIKLLPWQCDLGQRILDGEQVYSAWSDPGSCLEHADGFAKVGDDYLCSACWCWPEDLADYPGDDEWTGTDDEVRRHSTHPGSGDPS